MTKSMPDWVPREKRGRDDADQENGGGQERSRQSPAAVREADSAVCRRRQP